MISHRTADPSVRADWKPDTSSRHVGTYTYDTTTTRYGPAVRVDPFAPTRKAFSGFAYAVQSGAGNRCRTRTVTARRPMVDAVIYPCGLCGSRTLYAMAAPVARTCRTSDGNRISTVSRSDSEINNLHYRHRHARRRDEPPPLAVLAYVSRP